MHAIEVKQNKPGEGEGREGGKKRGDSQDITRKRFNCLTGAKTAVSTFFHSTPLRGNNHNFNSWLERILIPEHFLLCVLALFEWTIFVLHMCNYSVIIMGARLGFVPVFLTSRYGRTNVSPSNFDHFCTRHSTLCVPQRLIFTNEVEQSQSGRVRRVGSGRPCLRETPTFKHVHPSAMLQLH